jgi:hypothetical protein
MVAEEMGGRRKKEGTGCGRIKALLQAQPGVVYIGEWRMDRDGTNAGVQGDDNPEIKARTQRINRP